MAQETPLSPEDFARSLGGTVDVSDPDAVAAALGGSVETPAVKPKRSPVEEAFGNTQLFPGITPDVAMGAARGAVKTVQTLASPIRKMFGMEPATPPPEETTTGGKIGRGLESVAEFGLGSGAVSAGVKALGLTGKAALAAKSAGEGVASYGISKAQGSNETGARTAGVISAIAPVAGYALTHYGPKIAARARTQLAKVFASGLEGKGPMVDYAVQTGDIANKSVDSAVRIVRQAADDTLDLPVTASWGKWQSQLAKDTAAKGQTLRTALAGQFGSQDLPKQPIIDALDDLIRTSTEHLAQVTPGGHQMITYNAPLKAELEALKETLEKYGPTLTVRNLVDLKQTWDDAVYTISTSGKVGIAADVLASTAQKEAKQAGANAIRKLFDQSAPTIADLNEAYTHAKRLEDLVIKLHKVNPSMSGSAKELVKTVGTAAGAVIGHSQGGYELALLGAGIGRTATRGLITAMESPLWKTLTPAMKDRLATAIANGRGDDVLKVLAPVLSAGVSARQSPSRPGTGPNVAVP